MQWFFFGKSSNHYCNYNNTNEIMAYLEIRYHALIRNGHYIFALCCILLHLLQLLTTAHGTYNGFDSWALPVFSHTICHFQFLIRKHARMDWISSDLTLRICSNRSWKSYKKYLNVFILLLFVRLHYKRFMIYHISGSSFCNCSITLTKMQHQ